MTTMRMLQPLAKGQMLQSQYSLLNLMRFRTHLLPHSDQRRRAHIFLINEGHDMMIDRIISPEPHQDPTIIMLRTMMLRFEQA